MKNAFLVSASLLLCCGCGAEQHVDEAASKRFSAEVQAIADSLVKGEIKYPHQSVVARMNEIMSGMSSQARRIEVAHSYATMLGDIDLGALPFKRRGAVAPLYGQHICFAFRTMVKNGVDPNEAMSLFFDCIRKFHDAYISVPTSAKSDDESRCEFMERIECARALRDAYVYTVTLISRFWIPHMEDYIPVQYHEEFKRRFKTFLEGIGSTSRSIGVLP